MTYSATKHLKFYSHQAIFCAKVGKLSNLFICFQYKEIWPKLLSKDFRNEVIQMASMRPISEICERYHINCSAVHKYTKQYREAGNIDSLSRKHIRTPSKLLFGDNMLLEMIVQSKESPSLKAINWN